MAVANADEDEEEKGGNEGLASVLAGVGLAAAIVVLAFQLMTANVWINAPDSQTPGDWMQLSPL